MIEITPLAAEKLTNYLTQNKIKTPVRIAAMNGCGGPSLGLGLDEQKQGDHVLTEANFTLLLDPGLARTCGKVKVDYVEQSSGCGGGSGFTITPDRPLSRAGGGCGGGSCASKGCGC